MSRSFSSVWIVWVSSRLGPSKSMETFFSWALLFLLFVNPAMSASERDAFLSKPVTDCGVKQSGSLRQLLLLCSKNCPFWPASTFHFCKKDFDERLLGNNGVFSASAFAFSFLVKLSMSLWDLWWLDIAQWNFSDASGRHLLLLSTHIFFTDNLSMDTLHSRDEGARGLGMSKSNDDVLLDFPPVRLNCTFFAGVFPLPVESSLKELSTFFMVGSSGITSEQGLIPKLVSVLGEENVSWMSTILFVSEYLDWTSSLAVVNSVPLRDSDLNSWRFTWCFWSGTESAFPSFTWSAGSSGKSWFNSLVSEWYFWSFAVLPSVTPKSFM